MVNVVRLDTHRQSRQSLKSAPQAPSENLNPIWIECLVNVAKHQDQVSFQRLFEHFAPKLNSFFLKHNLTQQESEELTQETFISVWKFANYFEANKGQVSTWIYTIARNKKLDYYRKQSRAVKTAELVNTDIASEEGNQFIAQAGDEVKSMLDQLPPEQVEVLQKVYFEELSHQKAADALNITLGTVKGRIRSAVNNLNKLMRGGK